MRVFYGKPRRHGLGLSLAEFRDDELPNLTCSTIPLLSFWRTPEERVSRLRHQLLVPFPADGDVCFEYPVPPPGGTASQTDVMFLSHRLMCAFEGKWTEGRYQTVADWLEEGDHANRVAVLNHWLGLIRPYCEGDLPAPGNAILGDLVYQMVHRTASACSEGKELACVVYQCYVDEDHQHEHVQLDLQALVDCFHPTDRLRFYLHRIGLETTAAYAQLNHEIEPMGAHERANAIRNALPEGELFRFEWEDVVRITEGAQ